MQSDRGNIGDYRYLPENMIPEKKVTPSKSELLKSKRGFIKGPIDLTWISAVAKLPGKTLNVGLALVWLSGLNRSKAGLKLTRTVYDLFNVSRQSTAKALQAMEEAGLIKVDRMSGRKNLITILDVSPKNQGTPDAGKHCGKED